jgi:hypothetical protein
MNSTIFWYITPCSPLQVNRRFGGTYRLHLQGWRIFRTRNQREKGWQAELGLKINSVLHFLRLKCCMNFSSSQCVLNISPIPSSLTWLDYRNNIRRSQIMQLIVHTFLQAPVRPDTHQRPKSSCQMCHSVHFKFSFTSLGWNRMAENWWNAESALHSYTRKHFC